MNTNLSGGVELLFTPYIIYLLFQSLSHHKDKLIIEVRQEIIQKSFQALESSLFYFKLKWSATFLILKF